MVDILKVIGAFILFLSIFVLGFVLISILPMSEDVKVLLDIVWGAGYIIIIIIGVTELLV